MPNFRLLLHEAQQSFLNCSYEQAYIALVFAFEQQKDEIDLSEDWFAKHHTSILYILDELSEFATGGLPYQFVCGFILSNSEDQAELIRALFHLDQAKSVARCYCEGRENARTLICPVCMNIRYLKTRIFTKLEWFSSALSNSHVPARLEYYYSNHVTSFYKARINEHFPLSHTRESVNRQYLECLQKAPLDKNILPQWLRFTRTRKIPVDVYRGEFSDFINPILKSSECDIKKITNQISYVSFIKYLKIQQDYEWGKGNDKYRHLEKELSQYFKDLLANFYKDDQEDEKSEKLFYDVYPKDIILDCFQGYKQLENEHSRCITDFHFGKYKSISHLDVWRGTIHNLQNSPKIYTFIELLLNFLFHRLKNQNSIRFPFPVDKLEKYDDVFITSDNSDLYLEFKLNRIIIHSSEEKKVPRYIEIIQKILSVNFHKWILAYKRERRDFVSSDCEYGERLITSADQLTDLVGNPTYILWALKNHDEFCIHPFNLNFLRQSECIYLDTFETFKSPNSITFNPIFNHYVPDIVPERLFLENIVNWYERRDYNMYDDPYDSFYDSNDASVSFDDNLFCGACHESPCMCSDPFQTSTLI